MTGSILAATTLAAGVASGVGSDLAAGQAVSADEQAAGLFTPYENEGSQAEGELGNYETEAESGKGPLAPWQGTFVAPTAAQAEAQPGYKFQLQEGEDAINNSASATGDLLNPNTARAESNYAENAAQTDYNNVFSQSLTGYQQGYSQYMNNQNALFQRLFGESQLGEQASQGGASALEKKGSDQAAGTLGLFNGISNGISGASKSVLLGSLLGGQSATPEAQQVITNPSLFNYGGAGASPVAPDPMDPSLYVNQAGSQGGS